MKTDAVGQPEDRVLVRELSDISMESVVCARIVYDKVQTFFLADAVPPFHPVI